MFLRYNIRRHIQCILIIAFGRRQTDKTSFRYREMTDIHIGRCSIVTIVHHLDNHLTALLIILRITVDTLSSHAFEFGSNNLLAVQETAYTVTIHLYTHVIPFAGLNLASYSSRLALTAIYDLFQTMLRIAPTAQIPPAIIVLLLIIEHHAESLIATVFTRAYIIYILLSLYRLVEGSHTTLAHGSLREYAIFHLPFSAGGIHQRSGIAAVIRHRIRTGHLHIIK